ncbi:MAG: diaminopimelate epimerase [Elusimicrobia bacterium]|nr:diaminopimelate epimerase [Elusimicrobiota bacterium]
MKIRKFSANGNTFALIDLRKGKTPSPSMGDGRSPTLHSFGDGAVGVKFARIVSAKLKTDGLLVIRGKIGFPRLVFFNPDGSKAFCGNGTRTAGFYEIRKVQGRRRGLVTVTTDHGPIEVKVENNKAALLGVQKPRILGKVCLKLRIGRSFAPSLFRSFVFYKVRSGCPHAVCFDDNVEKLDIVKLGRIVRYHKAFAPKGTNVDFVQVGSGGIKIRTYERGVERETKSCGSGVLASVSTAKALGKIHNSEVRAATKGGILKVRFNGIAMELEGFVQEVSC